MSGPAGRSRRLLAGLAGALAVTAVILSSCGDGQPDYCQDLARNADMGSLTKALDAKDLKAARAAAAEFKDMAASAPSDIRSDMDDLAAAVTDIIGLLSAERMAGPGAGATSTTSTTAASGTTPSSGSDPADVEQRREELNRRLGELSVTSSRVEDWASRNCGISLSGA